MKRGWNLLLVDRNNDIFFAEQVKLGCPFSNAIITIFDAKESCEKNTVNIPFNTSGDVLPGI